VEGFVFNPYFTPNNEMWSRTGFTSIQITHQNASLIAGLPSNSLWGRSFYPGVEDYRYLADGEMQHANEYLSFRYGDELLDVADPARQNDMRTTYDNWNTLYPNTLAFTNFWGGQLDANALKSYMETTRPDMLMFDHYLGLFSTRETWYAEMCKYRTTALAGFDGSGTKPLPYAQYTRAFLRNGYSDPLPGESFVRVQHFASWAFGYTFTSAFVYNTPFNAEPGTAYSAMFSTEGDSNPTPVFGYVAETNRQSRNLGPALVRLVSTDIRIIPATYATHQERYWDWGWKYRTVDDNLAMPEGISEWSRGAGGDNYITGITPLGNDNGVSHVHGDVLIGYSRPLLASNPGCTFADGLHFMIVNGRGTSESEWWDSTGTTAESMAEWYRLTFDFTGSQFDSLVRLSRETGQVELVALNPLGASRYSLDLYLEGGTGDLFRFWDSSNPLPSVPEPGALVLTATGFIGLLVYRRKQRR
jgi:hypothetical protein